MKTFKLIAALTATVVALPVAYVTLTALLTGAPILTVVALAALAITIIRR